MARSSLGKEAQEEKQTERLPTHFDLVRITASKREVNLAPNTIRALFTQGLRAYRHGKMVFFSKSELEMLIRSKAA